MGGKCEISQKRVDRQWGPWGETIQINETNTSYVEYVTRETSVDYAHGGLEGTEAAEMVQRSLIWVKEGLSWQNAKTHCESLGGSMFSNFDGTESQLLFFAEKFNNQHFWLGVYTNDHQDWLSVDDDDVVDPELLRWRDGEPNNGGGNSNYVSSKDGSLGDDQEHHEVSSVCDISTNN